ncbi:MAG TPA: serine/threonine-protein kinase [Gemmatimonadaceae bacterium]|nr:serine/threonine-protein kinase [Gemmatimonadaceae bacterium]
MMRCPRCGATFRADAKFCTRDGTPLVAAPRPAPPRPPAPEKETAPRALDPGPRVSAGHAHLTGAVLDGRYRIAKKIGEGGMSYVYLAHDVATGERFAIKVLAPALAQDPKAMARLRREAGLGIRLAHPNICHIMRLGETEDGLVYIVMPFVEGELLADRTNRLGHIPLPETVRFVKDIAAGLQLAHSLAIVHRDLKPENVMICVQPGGEERAVVMDFGLAKERRSGAELEKLTATGIVLGTPEFMSPEQLRGKTLDGRSDIYSLALMTFEMLTGKLPFSGRTQQELMVNRLRSEPTGIRRVRPELGFSTALEKVLLRGMDRSPDARYATAPEFAAALEAVARDDAGEPPEGGGLLGRLFGR